MFQAGLLKDKTFVITGAGTGLGAEMARQFAAGGNDLALCARRLERLEELRAEILAAHPDRRSPRATVTSRSGTWCSCNSIATRAAR